MVSIANHEGTRAKAIVTGTEERRFVLARADRRQTQRWREMSSA